MTSTEHQGIGPRRPAPTPTVDVGAAYDARSEEYVERFGRLDQHPAADRAVILGWRGTALPLPSGTVGGVLAWYSVIHTPPDALPSVLVELGRVLRADGSLLLGVVDGAAGQGFAHAVVTAYSWSVDALTSLLADAGLEVLEHHRRQDPGVRPHADLIARRRG